MNIEKIYKEIYNLNLELERLNYILGFGYVRDEGTRKILKERRLEIRQILGFQIQDGFEYFGDTTTLTGPFSIDSSGQK